MLLRKLPFLFFIWSLSQNSSYGNNQLKPPLTRGDLAFERRDIKEELQTAIDSYKTAMLEKKQLIEASWKYSMALQSYASRFVEDSSQQMEIFKEASEVAKRAAEQDSKCGPCEFWAAINLAQYGEKVGVFKMLGNLSEIISRLEKAAALNPQHAMAGPYRVLGIIYQSLPGIIGGDDEKALTFFERAISLTPNEPINYLAMAKLKNEEGDYDQARDFAKKGIAFMTDPHISLESRESYRELLYLSQLSRGSGSP